MKDDGGPAFPGKVLVSCRALDGEPLFDYPFGASLLDLFAGQAMRGFLSASYGDEGYMPALSAGDFVESDGGRWACNNGRFYPFRADYENDGKRYSMVTTHEQRIARDAYSQAAAMVAEKRRRETADV